MYLKDVGQAGRSMEHHGVLRLGLGRSLDSASIFQRRCDKLEEEMIRTLSELESKARRVIWVLTRRNDARFETRPQVPSTGTLLALAVTMLLIAGSALDA